MPYKFNPFSGKLDYYEYPTVIDGGEEDTYIPPFVPTDVAGCVIWLRSDLAWQDAAKTIACASDADLIYVGEDKSLTNDVIQATEGARPKFYTNQINSIYPCWRFDGANDVLISGAFAWARPNTVYLVLKQIAWSNSDFIYDAVGPDAGMGLFQYPVTPSLIIHDGNPACEVSTLSVGSWGILRMIHNSLNSSIRYNQGVPITGNTGGNVPPGGFTLGRIGTTNALYGNFDVAEMLGYNAVSSEDDVLIMDYLNTRYAIY